MEEIDDEKSTPEVLQRFIDQYRSHIEEASYYVEMRNWGREVTQSFYPDLKKEHDTEWKIISNIAEKLKTFMSEAEGNLHRKFARDFILLLKGLLDGYIDRVNIYRGFNKWSEIEDPDYMDLQLIFQEELLKNVHVLRKIMSKINLDEAKDTKKVFIHADKKVPFLMEEIIKKEFPKEFSK